MLSEFAHFALILALAVACLQATVPLVGAQRGWTGWMDFAGTAATVQLALVAGAFAALTAAFVASDFTLRLVVANSHSLKPMLYKVTGVWGNHEGSMLLWALIVALFGALAAWFGGGLTPSLRARALAVQGMIGASFLAFILFTSNPFLRMDVPPMDGNDLNPLLQDPGLAFHPPFLYAGYVGLSMTFSFAVAALIEGRVDASWGRWVRPYTLAAWMFLTVGIAMGSWWAYYELGWGGFWFWDPVENASFMPWLITVALLHSAVVVEKRESLKGWTILLAIAAFGFSMIGAFITRSGVITSVHAFASDPERGAFLLLILAAFMLLGLALYALRIGALESRGVFGVASREAALVINNVLLGVACFVVFLGTIWPLASEMALSRKVSVGPPFFNAAFTPFMLALALVLPVGAILPWKRARIGRALWRLRGAAALAVAVGCLAYALQTGRSALGPVGMLLGAWLAAGAASDLWLRSGGTVRRLLRLPRADWGRAVAHAGFGVAVAGIAGMSAWQSEDIRVVKVGQSYAFGEYAITLADVREVAGPNYISTTGQFEISKDGRRVATMLPEKRRYPVAGSSTTEAALSSGFLGDLYLVLGEPQDSGGWSVRAYRKPLANWIWGGAILMALGAALSLSDRRHRVGVGAPRGTQA